MSRVGRLVVLSLLFYLAQSHDPSCGCATCQNSCSNCPLPEVSKSNLPLKNKDWVSSPFLVKNSKYGSGCDRLVCADPDAILFVRGKSLAYLTCSRKQWVYGRMNEYTTSSAICALPPKAGGCGPAGPPGPPGEPGKPGVCPGCQKGCPELVSIYVPEVHCIDAWDCNPLPHGTTTKTFACPGGALASKDVSSGEWRSENINGATCSKKNKWDFAFDSERLYACLSDGCVYSDLKTCKENFFCEGSTIFKSNKNQEKKIQCGPPPFAMYDESSKVLTQPQVCFNGTWKSNGENRLDVFCGYECDNTCEFKKKADHTAPNFVDPVYASPDPEEDPETTCPWAQCPDGAIYAWSDLSNQYERIPFLKAQCASAGDQTRPWVIGTQRFESIQCHDDRLPCQKCDMTKIIEASNGACSTQAEMLCKSKPIVAPGEDQCPSVACDGTDQLILLTTATESRPVTDPATVKCDDGTWKADSVALTGSEVGFVCGIACTCSEVDFNTNPDASIYTANDEVCVAPKPGGKCKASCPPGSVTRYEKVGNEAPQTAVNEFTCVGAAWIDPEINTAEGVTCVFKQSYNFATTPVEFSNCPVLATHTCAIPGDCDLSQLVYLPSGNGAIARCKQGQLITDKVEIVGSTTCNSDSWPVTAANCDVGTTPMAACLEKLTKIPKENLEGSCVFGVCTISCKNKLEDIYYSVLGGQPRFGSLLCVDNKDLVNREGPVDNPSEAECKE